MGVGGVAPGGAGGMGVGGAGGMGAGGAGGMASWPPDACIGTDCEQWPTSACGNCLIATSQQGCTDEANACYADSECIGFLRGTSPGASDNVHVQAFFTCACASGMCG
jgi:hypothetical protein